MRSLKRLLIEATLITITTLSFGATAGVFEHNSNAYLDDQYNIIKYMFIDLEVAKTSDFEIKVVIPTEYGFQTGKSTLKRPMKDKLRSLSKVLQDYNESSIEIIGHTDSVGSEKSNLQLGKDRADAVRKVLLLGKVNPYRIESLSDGEEVPKCTNETEEGRECNRRVEINIMLEKELARY